MRHISNLKATDLDKVEDFVKRNGCDAIVERIEKDCDGVGNIIAWTNEHAFNDWQQENDVIFFDCRLPEICRSTTNEVHESIRIPIHSSRVPTHTLRNDDEHYCATAFDAYDGELRPIMYASSLSNLGRRLLRDQDNLGVHGFVLYVYRSIEEASSGKRRRAPCIRLTYEQLGEPKQNK